MKINPDILKKEIINTLKGQGFLLTNDVQEIVPCEGNEKDGIRSLHKERRKRKVNSEFNFIKRNIKSLSRFFADGTHINTEMFSPRLLPVKVNTEMSDLFRLSTLLWSVPVSQGFGRRLRFLVIDESNEKLVGLFAIGDPVFNLRVRDELIGWDHYQRAKNLYHVMDIFILGAIPPYSNLLCGKLMGMMAASNEVRKIVYQKYVGSKTYITQQKKKPHLVLLTTASALGRSSIYNRIKYKDLKLYQRIGETKGWGHFHLGDGTFEKMRQYLDQVRHPIVRRNRFGQGPNWKMRTIRICLEELGLSSDLLRHGVKREVFWIPLAENFREYLLGLDMIPHYHDLPLTELVEYFKERWFIPRAKRVMEYMDISHTDTLEEIGKGIRQYLRSE